MIQVKEFNSNIYIDKPINEWIGNNSNIDIVDIKYSSDGKCSNALVVYRIFKPVNI